MLLKVCTKPYDLPPAADGYSPVRIEPGTSTIISVNGIQMDETYYPNPDKFDPERFVNDQVDKDTYLPFGVGPRICLGKFTSSIINLLHWIF